MLRGEPKAVGQLRKVYLEITNVCNMNCSFCPGTRREPGFLTPEDFSVLAAKLRPHTEYLYLHLMGEPLLHPQLEEILLRAERLGFRVMITTNGTLLGDQGNLLCASPVVERVSISLQSFEGNGGEEPEQYLKQCIHFARQAAGVGKRCALRLWNLDGEDVRGANTCNDKIVSVLETSFPRPWKEGSRGITLTSNIFLEWGETFEWPDLSSPETDRPSFCYGLRDQVGVLWDGTVVPCCLDHEGDIPLGNLYQKTLKEILDSPRARTIYEGFSQGRAREALCRRCGYSKRFKV